jgi:hypothetical protein
MIWLVCDCLATAQLVWSFQLRNWPSLKADHLNEMKHWSLPCYFGGPRKRLSCLAKTFSGTPLLNSFQGND